MKTFKEFINEKGICWTGYKRVPGTKPYSKGSCEKKEEVELEESEHKVGDRVTVNNSLLGKKSGVVTKIVKRGDGLGIIVKHDGEKVGKTSYPPHKVMKEEVEFYGESHYVLAHSRSRGISSPVKDLEGNVEKHETKESAYKRASELNAKSSSPHVYYTYGGEMHEDIEFYEEYGAEELFDILEEVIEDIAESNNMDSEIIWEDFEEVSDEELFETAAWRRKEGKDPKGGLNRKGVASYRRENPGSKLKMAVTTPPSKLKKGSKAAKRRKSFCARMSGMKGPMRKNGKPTRKALALRKWNCR